MPSASGADRARVEGVRRIAVLRANGLGDFLVTIPALQALRDAYPLAEITIIGDAWLPSLIAGRPGPWNHVVVAPSFPGLRGRPSDAPPSPEATSFLRDHRTVGYDLAVQLHGGGANSNLFVAELAAGLTVGARAPGAPPLDRSVAYVADRNELLRCLEIVELVGASCTGTAGLTPSLTVLDADVADSVSVWPGTEPFVAVHPGARDPRRRWSTSSYAELVRRLAESGLGTVLVGSVDDVRLAHQVRQEAGVECADVTGSLSLGASLGLLSRATLFVGNDSGPRHLAMAAGVPTVGIFWARHALTFGPAVVGAHRVLLSHRDDCRACGRRQSLERCGHEESFVDDVHVSDVLAASLDALSWADRARTRPGGGARRPLLV